MLRKQLPFLATLLTFTAAFAQAPEGYVLTWSDEFDQADGTAPDPTKWSYEVGNWGWGNAEVQNYTNSLDNSRIENGNLVIEVHQDTSSGSPKYTSARLVTKEKAQWKFGRIEVRAKVASETGTWSAIWMLAADTQYSTVQWPDNGEIDIMEHVGYQEDPIFQALEGVQDNIHGTLHTYTRNGLNNTQVGGSSLVPDASTNFKVYAINWTEDRIEFEVEGQVTHIIRADDLLPSRVPTTTPWLFWPFDQRFNLILNVAVGGNWGGLFNTTIPKYQTSPYGTDGIDHAGIWPQRMEIDYVRVYQAPRIDETPIPGTLSATELDDSKGILIQKTPFQETGTNLYSIDANDWAIFQVEAPRPGIFNASALIAAPGNVAISLSSVETGIQGEEQSIPGTGSLFNYQPADLGTVQFVQGLNTFKLDTTTGGFRIADIQLDVATDIPWQGVLIDGYGDLDTGSLLGPVNVNQAPWIYAYKMNQFLYSPDAANGNFHTGSQWLYVPKN